MPTMPLCSIVAFALCIGANADDALLHITQYADFLIINGPLRQFIRTLSSRSVICQGRAGEGCPCFYGRASEIRTAVHHSHTVQLQVFIHHTPKVLVFLHYSNLLNTDIKLLFSSLNSLLICITPHFSTLTSTDHSQHHSAKISNSRLINFSPSTKITASSAYNSTEINCFLYTSPLTQDIALYALTQGPGSHWCGYQVPEFFHPQSLH